MHVISNHATRIEFEEAGSLLEADRDAITISIEEEGVKPEKHKNSAGFLHDHDDDPSANDDNTEVWISVKLNMSMYVLS